MNRYRTERAYMARAQNISRLWDIIPGIISHSKITQLDE